MTQTELHDLLKTAGFDVAYHHFEEKKTPPFITYLYMGSSNLGADNKVYFSTSNYQVELYTVKKDPLSETLIESILDNANIYWEKLESYIESEKLYQIVYEINV